MKKYRKFVATPYQYTQTEKYQNKNNALKLLQFIFVSVPHFFLGHNLSRTNQLMWNFFGFSCVIYL